MNYGVNHVTTRRSLPDVLEQSYFLNRTPGPVLGEGGKQCNTR